LARKSLITVERVGGHARYGMLETIRQFAEEQLAANDASDEIRDRHAAHFAQQAIAYWASWDGPGYRVAVDWVEVELANLRAGFRWAADHADMVNATAIAAHTTMLAFFLQLFEPIGWAEEVLSAATAADVVQLPRLFTAASECTYVGRAHDAIAYAQTAIDLEADPRFEPFDSGWSRTTFALAHISANGDLELTLQILADLAAQNGVARINGLCGQLFWLSVVGRNAEARAFAPETLRAARTHGNPFWIALALIGYGRAFADTDPAGALDAFHEALVLTQEQRIPFYEDRVTQEAASLETTCGNVDRGLQLFDTAIDSLHRAGNLPHLTAALANLAMFFDRQAQPNVGAVLYGTSTLNGATSARVTGLADAVGRFRLVLGDKVFEECVAMGAAMEPAEAVRYARDQIQAARRQPADSN
jgi:hypothetical protein